MLTFQKMSTFQATQLLSCAYRSAYVPSSYAIISKGTLSIPCQVTLTFQDTQLRITFQDMLTLQKILLRYKLRSYSATLIHSKIRLGYATISKSTLSIPSQATLTFQDLQLRLRFKIHSHKDAFESLKISFPQD